jgi:uncharacterized protein
MFLSLPMLLELTETLQRPKFAGRLAGRGETAQTLTAKFREACLEAVPIPTMPPPRLCDPDDVHVLACAVGGGADLIVSGDKDLLTLGSFEGIPIVAAAEALKRLGLP